MHTIRGITGFYALVIELRAAVGDAKACGEFLTAQGGEMIWFGGGMVFLNN